MVTTRQTSRLGPVRQKRGCAPGRDEPEPVPAADVAFGSARSSGRNVFRVHIGDLALGRSPSCRPERIESP